MNELRCKECGAMFAEGMAECPSCGCPITEAKVEPGGKSVISIEGTLKRLNLVSIFSLFLGVLIVIMGIVVMNKEVGVDTYTAKHYSVDSAAFGGDFYTEIYGATDIIVDELNDINSGVEVLSESMITMGNLICYSVGMMMIALGFAVVAISCNHLLNKKDNAQI